MKIFDRVQGIKPKLNKFDLSHENKLTHNMGTLIPILMQEVLPGDSWRVQSQIFMRALALIAPVMHRVDVWTHYFFVPNRLIWDEWESFITGGADGLAAPVHPYFDLKQAYDYNNNDIDSSTLVDYLGLFGAVQAMQYGEMKFEVNALPIRAYQLIYDQYYRDQNYIDSILFDGWKASGNTYTNSQRHNFLQLKNRAWEHDYFTSALPNTQRGTEVSLGNFDSVKLRNVQVVDPTTDLPVAAGGIGGAPNTIHGNAVGDLVDNPGGASETKVGLDADTNFGISVNALRQSISLQGFLEAMMRFGSRYVEYLRGVFGTNPKDARLQRPEYLGGGLQQLVISEVLQTGQPTGTSNLPQGNMAGHALSVGSTSGFSRSFDEHGFIVGIMSVLPKTSYNSAIHKGWFRASRLDYYQPHLAHLGEQPVIEAELQPVNNEDFTPYSLTSTDHLNSAEIGYQSRFAEYKYCFGQQHGQFNTNLGFWTLTRIFDGSASVGINANFITAAPRLDIFADEEAHQDHLLTQIYHNISVLRPIPYFSTPSLLYPSHA